MGIRTWLSRRRLSKQVLGSRSLVPHKPPEEKAPTPAPTQTLVVKTTTPVPKGNPLTALARLAATVWGLAMDLLWIVATIGLLYGALAIAASAGVPWAQDWLATVQGWWSQYGAVVWRKIFIH